MGKKFLKSATMRDLCAVFGREEELVERQAFIKSQNSKEGAAPQSVRFVREAGEDVAPKKRKLAELYSEEGAAEDEEVTEMFCPFVRGHYDTDGRDLPKTELLSWSRSQEDLDDPKYVTVPAEKTFTSVVTVGGKRFCSSSWEKNKRYAEQAAAIVALHCLGIKRLKTSAAGDSPTKTET